MTRKKLLPKPDINDKLRNARKKQKERQTPLLPKPDINDKLRNARKKQRERQTPLLPMPDISGQSRCLEEYKLRKASEELAWRHFWTISGLPKF